VPANVATAAITPLPVPEKLVPLLSAVALPPPVVSAATASMAPTFVPVLVALATPPPLVVDVKPAALPALVIVAFWLAPAAVLANTVACVPVLVQVMSLAVVAQTNCAAAGPAASRRPIANGSYPVWHLRHEHALPPLQGGRKPIASPAPMMPSRSRHFVCL
jgi:hypothetical protein